MSIENGPGEACIRALLEWGAARRRQRINRLASISTRSDGCIGAAPMRAAAHAMSTGDHERPTIEDKRAQPAAGIENATTRSQSDLPRSADRSDVPRRATTASCSPMKTTPAFSLRSNIASSSLGTEDRLDVRFRARAVATIRRALNASGAVITSIRAARCAWMGRGFARISGTAGIPRLRNPPPARDSAPRRRSPSLDHRPRCAGRGRTHEQDMTGETGQLDARGKFREISDHSRRRARSSGSNPRLGGFDGGRQS
jgi:hypothetical protein